MEIRDSRRQKLRKRVIEFVSIFSGHVTIGTTSPCSNSFAYIPYAFSAGGVTLQTNADHGY